MADRYAAGLIPLHRRPGEVDEGFNVFAMPFFIENPEEEAAVEKKLAPVLEKRLEAKGFHLLCWGSAGWLQVFSKKAAQVARRRQEREALPGKGSDKWDQWYVSNGFHPVALLPAESRRSSNSARA